MKNNKKTGQLFYKLVTVILLLTFVLSPLNVALADVSFTTQSSDTTSSSISPAVTQPTDNTTPTDPNSSQQPDSSAAVLSPAPPVVTTPTSPILSSDTALTTTLAQHDTDVNTALNSVTVKGATTPDIMHPMTLSASAPTQQTDAPQTSSLSRTKLSPQIDNTTGALEYTYPLVLPPGRNGMTPDLSLQYNSQNTANDSVIGYGWNLSIPYISRENKHGVDNLYNGTNTDYTISNKGELGQISGNNYQLRSDDGSFDKYAYIPTTSSWTVTTKTGLIYTYGSTSASRQDDAANNTSIYKWMLDSITDTNGNSISYTYFKDQGQIYPSVITYTNYGGVSGPFTITFGREVASTTPPTIYTTGFSVVTNYRINSITVAISGTTRHSYALTYSGSDGGVRSLLSSITETGIDPSGNSRSFSPEQFTYTNSGSKTFTAQSWPMPIHIVGSTRQDSRLGMSGDITGVEPNAKNGLLIDVNGDGIPDWIETENAGYVADTSSTFGSTNGKFYDVWLGNTSGGWNLSTAWTAALPVDSNGKQYEVNQYAGSVQVTDINGDGLPDFIITTVGSGLNSDVDTVWLNNGSGWTKSTTWTMPTVSVSGTTYGIALGYNNGTTGVSGYLYDTQLIDVNNDGLADIVQTTNDNFGSSTISDHYSVWLNTGTGWAKSTTWAMPVHPTGSGTYYGSMVTGQGTDAIIDVNGDGLPDWVETTYSATSNETYDIWLNTGTSWIRSTSWTLPVHTVALPPYTTTTAGVQLGFSQIICNVGIGNSYVCGTRSDTMIDVNGDGLADIVETTDYLPEYQVVWLNNGKNGWVRDTTWSMPTYENNSGFSGTPPMRLGNNGTYSTQIVDVNNDGLPDFVASCDCGTTATSANPQSPMIFINTGYGWATSSWGEPNRRTMGAYNGSILGYTYYNDIYDPTEWRTTVLQDVNGDGSPDWVESNQFQVPPATGAADQYERYEVWSNSATQSDLLSSIKFDHGANATYTYAPQTIVDKNATAQTQTVEVVTSTTLNDGTGVTGTTNYSYAKGKYFYQTNGAWRKFAGFQTVTITRPNSSKEIDYYHQGNGVDSSTYEFSDNEYLIGKLYRTDITDGSGNLYKRTTTEWTTTPIASVNNNVSFVYPNQTMIEDFDGNSTEKATAEIWTYNTTTGNLTTDTNYGQVNPATPLTYSDTGTDKTITTYIYATNGTGMYLVSNQTTVDQSSTKVLETGYYYDGQSAGVLTLGNQTKVARWKTGTTYISTFKSYNSNGTVATTTDGRGYITANTTYDSYNLYPVTVTDPLSHITHYTYDYQFGLVVQTTDPNGQIYISNYDGFGRMGSQQIPDPVTGSTTYRAQYGYTDTAIYGVTIRETYLYTDSGTAFDVEDYYDGFGRLIEEKRQTDPNNVWYNYSTTDYSYNSSGQLYQKSFPWNDYGSIQDRGGAGAALTITYTYDPEGRLLTTANNLGATTNSYDQWNDQVTDPNGNVKKYYYDAYGNLGQVDEVNSGTTYSTYYAWNLNKNLTKLTDTAGNIRSFSYDGLGNRLSSQDLHAPTDSTYGGWLYTYDNDNDLITAITPNTTINYTYDTTDRKLSEFYTGSPGADITYTYDTCTRGIGRLCSISMLTGTGANTAYTYDYDGNVASQSVVTNGNTFLTSYTYNRNGDIVTIIYPDGATISYNYLSDGLINSISRKESGSSIWTPVITSTSYSPDLRPVNIFYQDGTTTSNTYDPSKIYRLTSKQLWNAANVNLQNITYTYDPTGNLTNLLDASISDASKTVAYTYDNLNRLKTAVATSVHSGTTTYSQSYNYDTLGNISSGPIGTYLYQGNTGTNYANPDAATSINGVTYIYDKDGNATSNGTFTNTWNYKDQLIKTVSGTTTVNYYYDQDGNRVRYNVGTANTYYPNKYYSYDGTTKIKQIYLGNELVATVSTQSSVVTPFYIHSDLLLGTNVVTDSTGSKNQLLDYYPFGDIRLNEKTTTFDEKNKFGGHMYDGETDLNYLGARYYNAKIGRFISEDPTATNAPETLLMDPQQLNTYAYARNNPLIVIDPDGKTAMDVINGSVIGLGAGISSIAAGIANIITNPIGTLLNLPNVPSQIVNSLKQNGNSIANGNDFQRGFGITNSTVGLVGALVAPEGDAVEGSALLCRGGACEADTFLKGSNEYKADLNPNLSDPLTGISVNKGGNLSDLLKAGNLPNYGKYGSAIESDITNAGGSVSSAPTGSNPYHANINGLSAQQLEDFFKPTTQSNPFKLK